MTLTYARQSTLMEDVGRIKVLHVEPMSRQARGHGQTCKHPEDSKIKLASMNRVLFAYVCLRANLI